MTLIAESTKVVTIEGQARAVDTLSAEAQQLVRFYDDWKQKELDARSGLLMAQSALRSLGNDIAVAIKKADDEAAADEDVAIRKAALEAALDEAVAIKKADDEAAADEDVAIKKAALEAAIDEALDEAVGTGNGSE